MIVRDAKGNWNRYAQLGHFVGRSRKILRWDEENCNLQCSYCNCFRDKLDMLEAYKKAINDKYGDFTWERLEQTSKQNYKLTREYLDTVISDSKLQLNWYLSRTYSMVC